MKPVIISVKGGIAEVDQFPDGIEVIIRDYDNAGYCAECFEPIPQGDYYGLCDACRVQECDQ